MSNSAPHVQVGLKCGGQTPDRVAVVIAPAAVVGAYVIIGVFALIGQPRSERGLMWVRGDGVQMGVIHDPVTEAV